MVPGPSHTHTMECCTCQKGPAPLEFQLSQMSMNCTRSSRFSSGHSK
jgi:hypothetical protein